MMKSVVKKIVIAIVITIALIAAAICFLTGFLHIHKAIISPKNAEKILKEDRGSLEIIVDYFISTGYEEIWFNEYAKSKVDELEDENVREAILHLFSKGYYSIGMRGNTIEFSRWRVFYDLGAGIAYSIDGVNAPQIDYVVALEPLSEEHWYFYAVN